jgi:hypothetical protein
MVLDPKFFEFICKIHHKIYTLFLAICQQKVALTVCSSGQCANIFCSNADH